MRKGDLVQVKSGPDMLLNKMGKIIRYGNSNISVRIGERTYVMSDEDVQRISKAQLRQWVKYVSDARIQHHWYDLNHIYKRPSIKKLKKQAKIRKAATIDGQTYRIISYDNKDFVGAYLTNNYILKLFIKDNPVLCIDYSYVATNWTTDEIRKYRFYWANKEIKDRLRRCK